MMQIGVGLVPAPFLRLAAVNTASRAPAGKPQNLKKLYFTNVK
jgi:hypothetical protein